MENIQKSDLIMLMTDIVSAYVSSHTVSQEEIPAFMDTVYTTLVKLYKKCPDSIIAKDTLVPAVPIEKSVMPDYIVCLEDGKKLQMLKRHLMSSYNMTFEEYKERWDLPQDYPAVAPNYSKRRSSLAKENGLGRKKGTILSKKKAA